MRSLYGLWLRPSHDVRSILVLGALFLALLQAMTAYEIWRQHSTALTLAERNLNILADVLAGEIDRVVIAVDQVIERSTLDLSAETRRDAAATRQVMRDRAIGVPAIFGLMAVDSRGNALASLHTFSSRHQAFIDLVRDEAALTNRPFEIGTVRPDPFDGSPVIPFTRLRHDAEGLVDGLTTATLSVAFFRELLLQVKPLPGATLTLARSDGAILAQVPEGSGLSMVNMPEFRPHARDGGLLRGGGGDADDNRLAAFRTIRPYGLKLSVAIDSHDLLAPWRSNAIRLAVADLAMTLLFAAGLWLQARKRAADAESQARRRESERGHLMALFALDHSADMVVWADHTSQIIYANHAAHQHLAYPEGELLNLRVGDIDPAFPLREWPQRMEELRRTGTVRFDSILRDRNNRDLPAEVAVGLFHWDGKDYTCAVIRDTVERKRAEMVLAERTRRLEESNAELEQFAYVASHDLREPLRMVNGFLGLLATHLGDHLTAEARDYIAFARGGAQRMDRLILDLLEYSRVGSASKPLVPIALTEVARTVRHDLGGALEQAGAQLTMPEILPVVWGDSDELRRLFTNLIGNALKYRHPDRPPQIEIGVETQGGQITCHVHDNGIGIAPQYFDRIFRIFQRLHGRDSYDGTGVGLAICKKIVERHGGRIWVASTPEQGSTFFFTLRSAAGP